MEQREFLDLVAWMSCIGLPFPEFFLTLLLEKTKIKDKPAKTYSSTTKVRVISSSENSNDISDEEAEANHKITENSKINRNAHLSLSELSDNIIRPVASLAELKRCIEDPKVTLCRLTESIKTEKNIIIDRDIVIDLGGHNISSNTKNIRILDITKGNVALIGSGSIIANSGGGVAVRLRGSDNPEAEKYTSITVGSEVMLQATSNDFSYGLIISPNHRAAYGLTVNLYGVIDAYNGVYLNGNITAKKGNVPVINIDNGAAITAHPDDGTAICAAGYGIWELGDTTLVGASGINIKAGRMTVDGSTISTTGSASKENLPFSLASGAVFQIEDNDISVVKVDLKIKDGIFISQNHHIFHEYALDQTNSHNLRSLKISGGSFIAGDGKQIFSGLPKNEVIQISGGSFSNDVFAHLKPGVKLSSQIIRNDDGSKTRMWEVDNTNDLEIKKQQEKKAKLEASKLTLAKVALLNAGQSLESYNDSSYSEYDNEKQYETQNYYSEPASYNYSYSDEQPTNFTVNNLPVVTQPVDCTILSEILTAAEEIDESAYTAESYHKLASVLESARSLLDYPTLASQDDVDAIVVAVALSTSELVEKPREDLRALSLAALKERINAQNSYHEPRVQEAQVVSPAEIYYNTGYPSYIGSQSQQPASYNNRESWYHGNQSYLGNSNYQNFSPVYNYYNYTPYAMPMQPMNPAWANPFSNEQYQAPMLTSSYPMQNYHNQIAPQSSSINVYENYSQNSPHTPPQAAYYQPEEPKFDVNLLPQIQPSAPVSVPQQTFDNLYSISDNVNSTLTYSQPLNINNSSLLSMLEQAKNISAMDYTLSSFATLQNAIYAAEDVVSDPHVTLEEMDAAVFNLNLAISGLEKEANDDSNFYNSYQTVPQVVDVYRYGQPAY